MSDVINWKNVADANGLSYKEFESQLLMAAFAMLIERLKDAESEDGDCIQITKTGHRMLFTKFD
jgi:hypothetical protein